jgi:glycosyltransferase involved in cell wall biosynthesis
MGNDIDDRPLRLAHVFATYDAGGPQVRTIEVMRALGPAFAHTVLAADGRTGAASRTPVTVPVAAMRRPAPAWRQVADLVAALRRLRPDLVLTYNWGALLGGVAARLLGLPFVHHEEVVPPEERAAKLRRRDWLRRALLARAAAVVTPSATMTLRARQRWLVPQDRLVRIDNGVDLADRTVRDHHAAAPGPLVVGAVAHARIEKNWPRLLRAFARMRTPSARLLIAGDGPERAAAERLARELGVAGRATLLGAVEEPRPCYAAMDVFALASDDEQMPLCVLEAMAHGLPVVATDVGDVAAMLPPEQRRYVVPTNPGAAAAMAAALDEVLADAPLRARLGAANRAWAERRHDLRGVAARYGALYRRCARAAAPVEACA